MAEQSEAVPSFGFPPGGRQEPGITITDLCHRDRLLDQPCRGGCSREPLTDHVGAGTLQCMADAGVLSQLRRGVVGYCVLALLAEGERYGFELVRMLSDLGGLVTSEGTIYPLLGRLRREGTVATSWRESTSGPPRRYYRLTPHGRDALERFTAEWERFRSGVDAVLETGGTT